jgi:hypothetical protein
MNRVLLFFTLFILSVATISFADNSEQVITLKDGSQIVGELVGISDGVYTIKTPVIGNVQASANDVVSITSRRHGHDGASPGDVPDLDQRIANEQKQLMSDPKSMALMVQMTQDPEIMQLLQDPALVEAVTHHDLQAVGSNPKIKELINNPHMQEFLKKLEALQHHDHDAAPVQ